MFKVFHDSIELVRAILTFIKATRQGNWDLHLAALESLTKYFFAIDKLKCARMVHLYLSEMKELEDTDEDVLKEFKSGNLVLNKNEVPFCAIGPDHGIEHENHWMASLRAEARVLSQIERVGDFHHVGSLEVEGQSAEVESRLPGPI